MNLRLKPCEGARMRLRSGRSAVLVAIVAAALAGCPLESFPIPESPATCAADAECDDGNPCTGDACVDGRCELAAEPIDTDCSDDDLCNGKEACDGLGRCLEGTPLAVDDGVECTVDACDPATGVVTHMETPACTPPVMKGWTPTPLAGAPAPRVRHTAVWTGSKMIVWGGSVKGSPDVTDTGGVYDPVAGTWTPTSMVGAPGPRHSHEAVWTGSKMIVWGGYGLSDYEITGGVYDPVSDTWTPMSTAAAPPGRTEASSIWTGAEFVVWGGSTGSTVFGGGGRFDPASDAWTPINNAAAPSPRFDHSAVWTGDRMIVWGGNDIFDWHDDGALYDPSTDTWTGATSATDVPQVREGHSALWTGTSMLIWGGWDGGPFLNSGGALDPAMGAGGTWTPITTAGAPSERWLHVALWTGAKMMIWGGCGTDTCATLYGEGGFWTPGAGGGAWESIAADAEKISARKGATGVWTGTSAIVWGGQVKTGFTDTGATLLPQR